MLLVATVVGSGIMAQRLSTDGSLVLLCNTLATVGILVALITAFGPISGAQFNPVVTLIDAALAGTRRRPAVRLATVIAAQVAGAVVGAIAANVMFGYPTFEWSKHVRHGGPMWFAEAVATFGLIVVIFTTVRSRHASHIAGVVGGYIGAAYFFTASTSFANPAVTVGRMFSNSYAGIAPSSAFLFVVMQLAGGIVGFCALAMLDPTPKGP